MWFFFFYSRFEFGAGVRTGAMKDLACGGRTGSLHSFMYALQPKKKNQDAVEAYKLVQNSRKRNQAQELHKFETLWKARTAQTPATVLEVPTETAFAIEKDLRPLLKMDKGTTGDENLYNLLDKLKIGVEALIEADLPIAALLEDCLDPLEQHLEEAAAKIQTDAFATTGPSATEKPQS